MKLPEIIRILIITLSDRAARGEYADLSGPAIRDRLAVMLEDAGLRYSADMHLIADDGDALRRLLEVAAGEYNVVFTTGGTGIGPRDITVDVVRPLLSFEIPGIMEVIRVRYGAVKPVALISRAVAGVCGRALVFTLPGSVKAVNEYLDVILPLLVHAIEMQYGVDSHGHHHG